jgi:hypothetical protein
VLGEKQRDVFFSSERYQIDHIFLDRMDDFTEIFLKVDQKHSCLPFLWSPVVGVELMDDFFYIFHSLSISSFENYGKEEGYIMRKDFLRNGISPQET